ncbi:MAG: 4-hydroxybenzoate octaprenyltransferase [Burkholderiaceae bacterium]|nr:4-hydroxybenzoate octaprenyltransferase [Burkholderiaceae bacterium]MCD8516295.1 4-hydroxybenzoate octaprenyltransferase [Burkholderiaceae bacterium]MCD8537154.1 4-hydroxybenzoate octaprenyltransferase [Burkholderiaceae bacterium]MCD8566302.1 4-hydroxybenzoate octaprenyltransferase [Burkholderiaceae bacterium]
MINRLGLYARLVRLDKPIGTLLLLWPTLWALWAAGQGSPPVPILLIFVAGTFLMRAAGCAINDYFDRDFDRHVQRTQARVLTTGLIKPKEALFVAASLAFIAFALVLLLNRLTIQLSFVALVLAATYPLMKRLFSVPQAYLGIAFGFGIPMAFAAITDSVPVVAWVFLLANIFWTVAYDTEYAMVDRDDDIKLGLKTAAITFGRFDVAAIGICYGLAIALLAYAGSLMGWGLAYLGGLFVAAGIAVTHLRWIRRRDRVACFRAFRHNNWFGAAVFAGIVLQYIVA